jgi:LmbE family N-acetylglucosaminyl deacetylase
MIPNNPTIVCIGAHPDDIELGCGGTLLRLFKRSRKHFVVCTAGHTGGNAIDRVVEADSAGQKLGADVSFLDFTDGKLYTELFELIGTLTEVISKQRPDIIFTHIESDHHQDHRSVCEATLSAVRNYNGLVLGYHSWSYLSQEYDLEVSVCPKKKQEILNLFTSQWQRPYLTVHASEFFKVLKWKI